MGRTTVAVGSLLGLAGVGLLWQMVVVLHSVNRVPLPQDSAAASPGLLASLAAASRSEQVAPAPPAPLAAADQARAAGADWDYRPPWVPVTADTKGLASKVWRELQGRPDATAYDAARSLLGAAKAAGTQLSVVQVGACDGAWEETNDPMQALLTDERTQALVVEPVPPNFEELRIRLASLPGAAQRLKAVNVAICLEAAEAVAFYVVSDRYAKDHPESPHWAKKELGSFDKKHLKKHRIPDSYIDTLKVPCMTAPDLLEKTEGSPWGADSSVVDALVVDAEGLDGDLTLAFLALETFRPALIIFEQKHLKRDKLKGVLHKMRELRYVFWRDADQVVALLAAPIGSDEVI